jgi:hypothetical protein
MNMTTCPECGAVAEIVERHVLGSTDGPMEHVKVRCVDRHWFFLPVSWLARALEESRRTPARSDADRVVTLSRE